MILSLWFRAERKKRTGARPRWMWRRLLAALDRHFRYEGDIGGIEIEGSRE